MIGISKRLVEVGTVDGAKLRDCYTLLLNDRDYRGFVESNTASEVSLKGRINKAIETFKDI